MDRYRCAAVLLLCGIAATLSGCNLIAAGAVVADKAFPTKIDPQYKHLNEETVAIMVWAERGLRIDYPNIQIDLATALQNKFLAAQKDKAGELKETKFPIKPASIVRYQMDHPQTQSMAITDLAPKLAAKTGLTCLIYIEIDDFSTRIAPGVELFRGSMNGTIKVVEIHDGQGKVVYEENDVHAIFPKKSPEEGSPNGSDYAMYVGTVDAFTTEVIHRFVAYEEEE